MNQKKIHPKNDTMNTVIYSRVSSPGQDNERQIVNLKSIAQAKNWRVKRVFEEKISGTINSNARPVFNSMMQYLEENQVDLILVSEVSRLGRRVVDVLNRVESLHEKAIGLYIQQFDIITFKEGKEDTVAKMLLQMLSIGSEMENRMRRDRQIEGIRLAQLQQKYTGRKRGAKSNPTELLIKYKDIVELLDNSNLSLRRIAGITKHSINTVRKIANLKKL